MTDLDKYLNMLKSPKADTRYDACEELRLATESSPEIILALIEATQDENEDVAGRARQALGSDVHQRMGIKTGIEMGSYLPIVEKEVQTETKIEPEPVTLRKLFINFLQLVISFILWSVIGIVLIYLWNYLYNDYFLCRWSNFGSFNIRCIHPAWMIPTWWLLTIICIIITLIKKRYGMCVGVFVSSVLITCLMFVILVQW
jgi:hypothetical protein